MLCLYLLNLKILRHSYTYLVGLSKEFFKSVATFSLGTTKHRGHEGTYEGNIQNPNIVWFSAPNEDSPQDLGIHSPHHQKKPWCRDALYYESIRPRKLSQAEQEKCKLLSIRLAEKSAQIVRLAREIKS